MPARLLLVLTLAVACGGPAVAGAQPDERLASATRLQAEAAAALSGGRPQEGIPKAREALALREAVLGPDHRDVAQSAYTLGSLLRDAGDFRAGLASHRRALAIRERELGPDHLLTAQSLNAVGFLMHVLGDSSVGRQLLERALQIRERALGARHRTVATSLVDLGVVLAAQGEFAAARTALERALAIRERTLPANDPLTGTALHALGDFLRELGERAAARQHLQRALAIREASGSPSAIASTVQALGALALYDGDFAAARTAFERALGLRERTLGADHPWTATTVNELGVVFLRTGRYREAQAAFERALTIRERAFGPDHPSVAVSLRHLGDLRRRSGDLPAARAALERAVAIYEARVGTDHPATAVTLHALGNVLQEQGDLPGARGRFERALAVRERMYGAAHPNVAATLNALAHLGRREGDLVRARTYAERALGIRERFFGPDHHAIAWDLNLVGQILRSGRDFAGARPFHERALALSTKHGVAEMQWRAAVGLGVVSERTGRLAEAAAFYRQALQVIEQLAAQFEDGARAQFLQGDSKTAVYDSLARVLLRLHETDPARGHDREAFAALEAKKGRVVAEALGGLRPGAADPQARREAERVQTGQAELLALERALREEQEKDAAEQSAETVIALTTRLAQTKAEYLRQVQAFLTKYPKYKTLFVDQQTVDPKVLAKFAERLPTGTLVVQYFSAPDALYVFLVAAGGQFQVKSHPVPQEQLYALVRQYRGHLKAAETERLPWADDGSAAYRREVAPLKKIGAALAGHLLGPIAKELASYTDVVLIPNDLLLYLPIHALPRPAGGRERFLAETHVVSYLTQLELLDLLAPAKPRPDAPLLALANPDGTLPGATREVRALRGVRPTLTALEGEAATKAEFLRLAATFTHLHLATHGVLDPERPERSYLLVAGADEASQRLSIAEIAGLSLQRGLAILSACDTAVGEQMPGAALMTMAAAFSQAGVEAIVASLWKVNDAATRD
ncbi:MAG TPA: CHAT domain-containing tetratricopeptide repeat protein, partial [Terriglobales bacterium]|nr:CHAT domain-containing tetratricopeptide repeat protein [Terriglobales bacterium]